MKIYTEGETCKGSCALHKQDINAGALFLKKPVFRKRNRLFCSL